MSLGVGLAALTAITSIFLGEKAVVRQDRTDRTTVIYWEKWTGSEGEEMRKVVDAFNMTQHEIDVK